ncbi:MAG: ABC transporter ATP-binding protein [Dichotomicrobium sp.]
MEQRITRPALRASGLHRSFWQGPREINVLRGADLEIWPGQTVALVGPSGAGKSTLLQILGLLEQPDKGTVTIGDLECAALDDAARTQVRRTEVGFVYQFHHLLVEFSALENVILPQRIAGLDRAEAERRARDLLKIFGLVDRSDHRPAELSGGEQQRVAIARAVANAPKLLLADEPTGNLDPPTAERVFQQLLQFVRKAGLAAIIATHNLELAQRMDRLVQLEDGLLLEHDPAPAEAASGAS